MRVISNSGFGNASDSNTGIANAGNTKTGVNIGGLITACFSGTIQACPNSGFCNVGTGNSRLRS